MACVYPPVPSWHASVPPLPHTPALPPPSATQLASITDRAASLLSKDAEQYASSSASHSASDTHFIKTILSTGTLSDRLSALTLLVQASPVHNTAALDSLRSMALRGRAKGGRDEGLKAVRCVVDWWVGGGGPARKLKYFRDQPLLHPDVTDAHLLVWYFEDWLKKFIFSILQILETFSLDPLPYVRTQTLAFLATLLRAQPEQEQNLLRLLVNKLGDTDRAVCARASYHVLQVLQAHPAMKAVIVRDVRALVFRLPASTAAQAASSASADFLPKKNIHIRFADRSSTTSRSKNKEQKSSHGGLASWNSHAWHYSAVTLNQIVLTPTAGDRVVARTLVDMYFEMFEGILASKRDTGEIDDEHITTVKEKGKGKAEVTPDKKAKEYKGAAGFIVVEDCSSRLIGAILTGVNRALPFAQMHLSSDGSAVFQKHIDTLFHITHTSTFNISLQALTLILQISISLSPLASSSSKATTFSTSLRDRFCRTLYASLTDPRLSTSNKQALYLNLLFKALKADHDPSRVASFVRRFVQVLASGAGAGGAIEFVAGGLYLLGELFSTIPTLKQLFGNSISKPVPAGDVPTYDPRKRDPQYAHAFASPMYELLPLLHHYHPTISLHAQQLLASAPITGTPDLSLNTLSHFLDRFVYKNARKPKPKGSSAMQPSLTSLTSANGVTLVKGEAAGALGVPVNNERFWKRNQADVPADQVFLHSYFVRKDEREKEKARKVEKRKGKGGMDDEEAMNALQSGDENSGVGELDGEQESEEEEAGDGSEFQDDEPMDDSDGSDNGAFRFDDDEDDDGNEDGDDDDGDEDAFSLVEGSDADDLIPLHADVYMPMGLIEHDGSDESSEDDQWGGILIQPQQNKRKQDVDGGEKARKKQLRSVPTFASYEDYAKLIEDGPEDNI